MIRRCPLVWPLVLLLAGVAGCGSVSVDGDTQNTGGTSGSGAADGTTSSTTNDGGAGGTMCAPSRCPLPANECKVAVCINGACAEENVPDGQDAIAQVSGDCQKNVCQGGVVTPQNDDTDVASDAKDCTEDTCEAGTPKHVPLLAGACSDSGGAVCDSDGTGNCVECNADADCTGDVGDKTVCDVSKVCVAPHCMDGAMNGGETDVDCGGPECEQCADGLMCAGDMDCKSNHCEAMLCVAGSCDDGILNGDQLGETDVDCGGPICPKCIAGKTCEVDADCKNGTCDAGAKKCLYDWRAACQTDLECVTEHCVDGVCCDTACGGLCLACSAAKKGGGLNGACGFVSNYTDPDNECAADAPSSCGLTGVCVGGSCQVYPPDTICQAAQCTGPAMLDTSDLCNGAGQCVPQLNVDCTPYACVGDSCAIFCIDDSECAPGHYCSSMLCLPSKPIGSPCLSAQECQSGFCVDGVCCDTACDGLCQACSAVKKGGGVEGVCGAIPASTDPDGDCSQQSPATCGQTGVCDGAGACKLYPMGTVCAAAQCTGPWTLSNQDVCNGNGTCADGGTQDCSPYICSNNQCLTSCSTNAQCGGGYKCVPPYCAIVEGPCQSGADCQSGFCVDGVCCNTACVGLCQRCNLPGSVQTCALIPSGQDPDNECPGAQTCDGTGQCQ